jgi:Sec7-like guanine-nucleotide exchange factor
MSFILRVVRPSAIQSWIAANAPASLKATARESWRAYLAANSGTGQTLRDLEMSFYTQ